MKDRKDILMLAKEVGLKEDLITPSGDGIKSSLSSVKREIETLEEKILNAHSNVEEASQKIRDIKIKINEHGSRIDSIENEIKDNISQRTLKNFYFSLQTIWRTAKPVFIALGMGMLYMVSKALGFSMPF